MLSVITSLQIDEALRTQLKEAYGRERNFHDAAMRDGACKIAEDCGTYLNMDNWCSAYQTVMTSNIGH